MGAEQSTPIYEKQVICGLNPDFPDNADKIMTFIDKPILTNKAVIEIDYKTNDLKTCTSDVVLAVVKYLTGLQGSVMYQYFNQRILMGTTSYDSGSSIKTAFKALNKYGVVSDTEYPFDINKYTEDPSEELYQKAQFKDGFEYYQIRQEEIIKCLNYGIPVIVCHTVYADHKLIGGNCQLCIGYEGYKYIMHNGEEQYIADKLENVVGLWILKKQNKSQ